MTKQGFSLPEILIYLAILVIIIGIAIPILGQAKSDTEDSRVKGNLKTYNEAIIRAHLKGDDHPSIGPGATNTEAAMLHLLDSGYIIRK